MGCSEVSPGVGTNHTTLNNYCANEDKFLLQVWLLCFNSMLGMVEGRLSSLVLMWYNLMEVSTLTNPVKNL